MKYRLGRTIPFMLLALLPLLLLRRIRHQLEPWLARIIWIYLGMTLLGILIMPRAVMVHDYHWIWLWPPLALLAGVAADDLAGCLRSRILGAAYLGLVAVLGLRGVAALHAPDSVYLVPEWRAALTVRKLTAPDATVAVMPAYGGLPYTFLYYADRSVIKKGPGEIMDIGPGTNCLVIFDRARNRMPDHAALTARGWSIAPAPRNATYAVYVRRAR